MYKLIAIFLFIIANLHAQDKTLKLSGTDFANGKPIVILKGQYDKIHVENMYAQQIIISEENGSIKKSETSGDPVKNINAFDIDISGLGPGVYKLSTWACYYIAELPLIIELSPPNTSKKRSPKKC